MKFSIEKNVPIPETISRRIFSGNFGKWQFLDGMEIGDSFKLVVHMNDKEEINEVGSLRNSVYNKNAKNLKIGSTRKWVLGVESTTYDNRGEPQVVSYRCWRAA